MKTSFRLLGLTFGTLVLGLLFTSDGAAQCSAIRQQAPAHSRLYFQSGHAELHPAAFVRVDDHAGDSEGIVGFWHVKFVSKGSKGIPDGTEVDAGYSQWHSDGTEIMNSGGRSPLTGDFCLGVWEKVGRSTYKLNHFATAWDATGSNLVGPGNIREEVTLDRGGNQFMGTFTIDQYDESGNSLAHVQGVITGSRITVNTPPQSIF